MLLFGSKVGSALRRERSFGYARREADPKGFSDPQLFDILKDEALLMGIDATEKKRKQYMRMKAVRLEKNPNIFNTGEYSFMKLPFMK